jgi:putative Mg2+ transporter-C (MgtC) family protein
MEELVTTFAIMKFFGARAAVAIFAGFIIGIERTLSNHAAGIKTIVFVSLGSCLFSSLSFYLHEMYPQIDPTRIIGQIITGVGFLCGGVIFLNNQDNKISGLTSSAMIWSACALGTMAGTGLFFVPLFASVTMVLIVYILKKVEKKLECFDKDKNPLG